MITPSFGLTSTERVLPRMALDFTTAILDSRVTVARAGDTATVINSSGYVVPISANLPRFDYDPTTLACKGLLIEEARTNVILNSNDFSQATWAKTAIGVTACPDISPSGLTDAQTLTNTGGTGNCNSVVVGTSGISYTFSVWVKRRTGVGSIFLVDANGGNTTIAVTSSWKRFSVTVVSSSVTIRSYIRVTTAGDAIDVYGAQTEAGAFPTSYIPTTTTSLTRNADVVTMTGTNFSDWYNASEGTFDVSFDTAFPSSRWIFSANDGTSSNYIAADINSGGNVRFRVSSGGASQANITSVATILANTKVNQTSAFATNSFNQSVNAVLNTTDTSGSVPTINQLQIGALVSAYLNGHVSSLAYYPQRLTNAELQAFST